MAAGIIGSKRVRRGRDRGITPSRIRNSTPTPINVIGVSQAGAVVTVTFDQAVLRSGVPQYTLDGVLPSSAATVSPVAVALSYPGAGESSSIVIPWEDAAIRNATGGYADAGTYAIGFSAQAAVEDGQAAGFVGPGPQTEAA